MTATMRSVVAERHGEPPQVLAVRDRPLPQPGPGEVRLRLILSPIHTHDLEMVRGEYGQQPALPMTPGTEALGRVDALGPGVEHLEPGQRVCVAAAEGTWSEYFTVAARRVVPVPEAMPDEAACQLLAMPLSACLLLDALAPAAGDWMIQNAANGAVGRIVNVLARRRGVHVVNLVRSAAAARSLREADCAQVLCSEDADWPAQLARITQGAPLLHAVDSLGGDAANALLGVLGDGGTLLSFGSMSSLTLNLHVEHLLYRHLTVRGFWASRQAARTPPEERARMIAEIVDSVVSGQLVLTLDARHELAEVAQAVVAVTQPQRSGKVALHADRPTPPDGARR